MRSWVELVSESVWIEEKQMQRGELCVVFLKIVAIMSFLDQVNN